MKTSEKGIRMSSLQLHRERCASLPQEAPSWALELPQLMAAASHHDVYNVLGIFITTVFSLSPVLCVILSTPFGLSCLVLIVGGLFSAPA